MRYTKDHKAQTHAKIVENAATQLREKGARGVGVADLMKDVGLTHGGFYAHFGSREDLVNEAIAFAMDQNTTKWHQVFGDIPVGERYPALVEAYLSTFHRDRPGEGCAIAALAADVSREGAKTRRLFLNKLDDQVGLLAAEDGHLPPRKARQKAIGAMATLVGALVLARIAKSGAQSQEILEAGKSAVLAGRTPTGGRRAAPRRRTTTTKAKRTRRRVAGDKTSARGS
ncbi:MAG: TetR/AcrR family transcriptional regulator [Xanthobacteraceae bacterium]|nr:TetR/AcrR family transcriptional regulator [Xanthobacteraceae bacterium]